MCGGVCVNYLWELVIQADREAIGQEQIRFVDTRKAGPYQELAMESLNSTTLTEVCADGGPADLYVVEFNALYRFADEVGRLVDINLEGMAQTRKLYIDICMHYLARIDLMSGLSKYEYYRWLLTEDIIRRRFGGRIRSGFMSFTAAEKKIVIGNLLQLCRTGNYLQVFKRTVTAIYPQGIIYESKDSADELLVYLGKKETDAERMRINLLINLFLPLCENVYIFYNHHFGIIGVEETMMLDEMVLF